MSKAKTNIMIRRIVDVAMTVLLFLGRKYTGNCARDPGPDRSGAL